jgi:hypothetical protein
MFGISAASRLFVPARNNIKVRAVFKYSRLTILRERDITVWIDNFLNPTEAIFDE